VARRELLDYLRWAEESRTVEPLLDAASLLSAALAPQERADALERALELAAVLDPGADLAATYVEWASALDATGDTERALTAWTEALTRHRDLGRGRPVVASGWAAGAAACRLEDWPLARTLLEDALSASERSPGCEDLVALVLGDLSLVYEAAGDVVEARRLVLRALRTGREHHLASAWPERWAGLHAQARRLEVE
jgi:tetratricopeptide (TPR) repeat protein